MVRTPPEQTPDVDERTRRLVGAGFLAGAAVIVLGALAWFNQGDPLPPPAPATTTSTTSTAVSEPTRPGGPGEPEYGVPRRVEVSLLPPGETAIADLTLSTGSRFMFQLPATRARGLRITESEGPGAVASLEGPGFDAYLRFDFCTGEDAGRINASGSLVIGVDSEQVILCRPDQFLVMVFEMSDPFDVGETEMLHVIPIAYGSRYEESLASAGVEKTQCCFEQFGPLSTGAAIVVSNGHLDGQVMALNPETLVPIWSTNIGAASFLYGMTTPVSPEQVVLASAGTGQLVGLRAVDGGTAWTIDVGEASVTQMRALPRGEWLAALAYETEGDQRPPELLAIEPANGSVVWTGFGLPGTDWQYTSPVIVGDAVVMLDVPETAATASIHAFDLGTGERLWSAPLGSSSPVYTSAELIVADSERDLLFIMTIDGNLIRLDPTSGAELWRATVGYGAITGLAPEYITITRASREIDVDLESGDW